MNIIVKKCPDLDVLVFLHVQPSDSIDHLKDLIEDKIGMPCKAQRLLYCGRELAQGTVSDFNIIENSVVLLERKRDEMMNLFIKKLTGKTITVRISKTALVNDLKVEIEKKDGILTDQQRLIFAGRQLEGGRTLSEYGITDEAKIDLVLRLAGD